MMKKPNNWNEVQEFTNRPKLPLDAYVCKVKKAAIQNNGYGDQLCILFDIAEGEFAGFFGEEYKANQNQDKKWKGVLRVWLPKDDGSDKDEWTKRTLKGVVTSFEKSNPGYQFDWNEASLVGKMIGILFRNEEWEWEDKTGWAVRPFRAITVDRVRDEDFEIPKDKPLQKKAADSFADPFAGVSSMGIQGFAEMEDDDDGLPF